MLKCPDMSVNRKKPQPSGRAELRQPRYRQIAEQLAVAIAEGRYLVGTVLPGEHDLVEQHGVSRHTVRDALRCLSEAGLVARRRGIGTVVTAREPLSSHVQRVGSADSWMRYPPGSRLAVLAINEITADTALSRMLQCRRGSPWCHVSAVRRLGDGKTIIGWSDIYLQPEYSAVANSVGRSAGRVYELIESRFDAEVARIEVELRADILDAVRAKALGVPKGSPSLAVLRRYRGADGRVFFLTVAEHPAERFTYAFSLVRSADGSVWTPG